MPGNQVETLHLVLRGLASGAEPGRLLHQVLAGAVAATSALDGAVLRATAGAPTPVATTGELSAEAVEAAKGAIESGRMVRRRAPGSNATAAAEPVRAGGQMIGAVVVAGTMQRLDPAALPVYADATSLVLSRTQGGSAALAPMLAALVEVGADQDAAAVLGRVFDAARLFGAAAGFCALVEDGALRVAQFRGIEHADLLAASRHPEFRSVLGADRPRVLPHAHAVVALLARLGEVAAVLPLEADGRRLGQLVLLLDTDPPQEALALLATFARHAALCLRSARVSRSVGDREEQLAAMVHSMAHPVVVVDEAGKVTEMNGAATHAFRLADFDRGQPVAGRLGNKVLEDMLTGGEDRTAEVVVGHDGARVYRATVRRMRTAAGRQLGRILVLDDLTSERQVDALKADFVAVMGHELRTPLTVMKGYIHTLTRRWATISDERREQAFAALDSNAARLERLIEDLLFVSAIEQRQCPLDLQVHDLAALLQGWAGKRLVVRTPRRQVDVELDRAKVDQVLRHLVDNALKYSEGEVVLELADRGHQVEVSVSDTGPGIFSGDIPQLFERFRQLDGTSTRAHGGVGIGLYLCRRLVEALGGTIWCESRLGVGTRFTFSLPKEGPARQDPAVPRPMGAGLS